VEYEAKDEAMLSKLSQSGLIFAAHKNATFIQALTDALKDEQGNLLTFSEFRKVAQSIHGDYNQTWLRTEYNQAIGSAQMASQWIRIEAEKKMFPSLRYSTIGDANVRPAHAALEGIVKPVDDPFWDKYLPLNGWGCRCAVEQVDADAETTSDSATQTALNLAQIDNAFLVNVGKTGEPFGKDYKYYQDLSEAERKAAEKEAKKLTGNGK
jgi:SPP1 gp7 family putative phage head morphogenesis protein